MRARLENVFYETVETRVYRYGRLTVEVVIGKGKYEAWAVQNGAEKLFLFAVSREVIGERGFFGILETVVENLKEKSETADKVQTEEVTE